MVDNVRFMPINIKNAFPGAYPIAIHLTESSTPSELSDPDVHTQATLYIVGIDENPRTIKGVKEGDVYPIRLTYTPKNFPNIHGLGILVCQIQQMKLIFTKILNVQFLVLKPVGFYLIPVFLNLFITNMNINQLETL